MIAVNGECKDNHWQSAFLMLLPEIQRRLGLAFCHLTQEAREDSIEEGVVHCLLTYARLHDEGRAASVTPSSLAWFSSRQVKRGRPAVGRLNGKEPLSRYAQLGKGIHIEQVHGKWIEILVEDKRAPVSDQVAAKLDVSAWFATLTKRMKKIARDLALGFTTSEVANKYGVTPGRISQLRRSLEASWAAFQQEATRAAAT